MSAVLTAFMGGLALGSQLGGRLLSSLKSDTVMPAFERRLTPVELQAMAEHLSTRR